MKPKTKRIIYWATGVTGTALLLSYWTGIISGTFLLVTLGSAAAIATVYKGVKQKATVQKGSSKDLDLMEKEEWKEPDSRKYLKKVWAPDAYKEGERPFIDFKSDRTGSTEIDGRRFRYYVFGGGPKNRPMVVYIDETEDLGVVGHKPLEANEIKEDPFIYCDMVQDLKKQMQYNTAVQVTSGRKRNGKSADDVLPFDTSKKEEENGEGKEGG